MKHDITRRRALMGAIAMPAVAVGTAVTAYIPADPHPALWIEWQRLSQAWKDEFNRADEDTPASEAFWEAREEVGRRLLTTPATTLEGLQAQFEYVAEDLFDQGSLSYLNSNETATWIKLFRASLRGL